MKSGKKEKRGRKKKIKTIVLKRSGKVSFSKNGVDEKKFKLSAKVGSWNIYEKRDVRLNEKTVFPSFISDELLFFGHELYLRGRGNIRDLMEYCSKKRSSTEEI